MAKQKAVEPETRVRQIRMMIAAIVRWARESEGLSQLEFGARVGMSPTQIGNIERGIAPLSPRALAVMKTRTPALWEIVAPMRVGEFWAETGLPVFPYTEHIDVPLDAFIAACEGVTSAMQILQALQRLVRESRLDPDFADIGAENMQRAILRIGFVRAIAAVNSD